MQKEKGKGERRTFLFILLRKARPVFKCTCLPKLEHQKINTQMPNNMQTKVMNFFLAKTRESRCRLHAVINIIVRVDKLNSVSIIELHS